MSGTAYAQTECGTETILLVEDRADVRVLLVEVLTSRGYRVIEAEDGEDAVERAGAHAAPIHLVVSDVDMPRMSGPELFDKLRQWYPTLRVLFISGKPAGAVTSQLLKGGRTAFLGKPFVIAQLTSAMRGLLDGP